MHVLRTIQFIPRHRSIEIFYLRETVSLSSLTGNLRKLHLSVRTFMSIENETQRNDCLSVRTFTKKGTNIIFHIFRIFDIPADRYAKIRSVIDTSMKVQIIE